MFHFISCLALAKAVKFCMSASVNIKMSLMVNAVCPAHQIQVLLLYEMNVG